MFSTTDTIVAIATPPGRGGIGVVRAQRSRRARDRAALDRARERRSSRGTRRSTTIVGRDRRRRRSIRSSRPTFPRPHSYTGEDVVEISAHGSPVVLRRDRRSGDGARARGSPSQASSRCARS